ncbi:PIR Superfamily Protein [Plasmodium ovale wallikeri]|uniref:PIR Superfamily Protein n=1 Tax=Plasmodium ovale wallikeri TaxID=864142 RepID=A0A1A9ANG4_PLAOA|nr:PIR Superfamily Protein [Plasmodium ovale wallikeri]SBT57764.1 PIR Superfamily Protein [Plasmodium ovale wallikeri]
MPEAQEEEYYAIVNELPEHVNIINWAINDYFLSFNTEICKRFIIDHFNSNEKYINPCIGIVKYSHYLLYKEHAIHNESLQCKGLNYWLKNQIKDIQDNECDTSEFYEKLNLHDQANSYGINRCMKEMKDINDVLFQNLQKIYDLHDNLNEYMTKYMIEDETCCENASTCVDIYDSIITQCKTQPKSSMCNALKKFKDEYNAQMQKDIKCINVKKKLLYPEREETTVDKQREGEAHALSYRQSEQQEEDLSHTASPGLIPTKFNIIIISVVSLVVSMILFILYKFTTFRSILKNSIRKTKYMWKHQNEEYNELLLQEHESKNTEFGERLYSIAYHTS